MRSDSFLLLFSLLFAISIMKISNTTPPSQYQPKAISYINKKFQNDLKTFHQSTIDFNEYVIKFQEGAIDEKVLQENYFLLREAYKKVEFIIEYIDKEATDKLLNGAPLPKLEPKVADVVILEPRGLQVIDEIIGAKIDSDSCDQLQDQSKKLKDATKKITAYIQNRTLTDRQFFEAIRQGVVRLATLGITGFDTPGTTKGIDDAHTILTNATDYFKPYRVELTNVGANSLYKDIQKIINKGIKQTQDASFDTFDRMTFIKEVINPLYKKTKQIHLALDYETIAEVSKYPTSVNYASENLFDKEFLNSFYYVSIPNDSNFAEIAKLGKLLFYDPVLSKDNKMSCVTCHAPDKAFTDGMKTSFSNKGTHIKRNSMTLNYSVFASGFFHDLRTKRLEDQFEHVIFSEEEFDSSYQEIISKLEESPTYSKHFAKAFPAQKEPIKSNSIDYALTAYVMQLNPFDSPIDLYFTQEDAEVSQQVKNGFNLFSGKAACATCHFIPTFSGIVPPLFKDSESEVLGVPKDKNNPTILDDDLGRMGNGLTKDVAPFYYASFKTPTIRNSALTGPYMHNGIYDTLEEVMDFYNKGGGAGQGMDLNHQTLAPDPLNLTKEEISDLIAFIKSITDQSVATFPKEIPRDFTIQTINERLLME